MNKIRCVIDSPLQLLNSIEFLAKFKNSEKEVVVILNKNKINSSQIFYICKMYGIFPVIIKRNLIGLFSIFMQNHGENFLVFGDYRSFFQKIYFILAPNAEKILVDDGSITPEIITRYLDINRSRIDLDSTIKSLVINSLKIFAGEPKKKIKVFTVFDIKRSWVVKNNYEWVINEPIFDKYAIEKRFQMAIIGSNYKQLGLSVEDIGRHYKKILEIMGEKEVLYFPHRKIDSRYLSEIKKIMPIVKCRFPVEIEFLIMKMKPRVIVSTYSGALLT